MNPKTNISKTILNPPIMNAAGPLVRDYQSAYNISQTKAGALVTKTISLKEPKIPKPCMAQIKGGFLNCETWSEMPLSMWLKILPRIKKLNLPLIISLGYTSNDIARLIPQIAPYADAIELSTHYLGDEINVFKETVFEARSKTNLPLWVKLSPNLSNLAEFALAAENSGADAIVAVNSFGPAMIIDVESGLPIMGASSGYGWLSGPAIFPIALRIVFELSQGLKIPIIGVGGISSANEVIQMIMAGAKAVQICTSAILQGPKIFDKIAQELKDFLHRHNLSGYEEIHGLTYKKLKNKKINYTEISIKINSTLCNACELCKVSCPYYAIEIKNTAKINKEFCFGCGLCITRCPRGAIKIISNDK